MAAPQATVPALGAAELVGAALEAFAVDPELLAAERGRIRLLLVDDAQHLDPQAALLVRVLAAGAELAVVAGDPEPVGVRLPRRRSGAARATGDHPTVVADRRRTGARRRSRGPSPASPAGCPVSTTRKRGDRRTIAGFGGGADRRVAARRVRR